MRARIIPTVAAAALALAPILAGCSAGGSAATTPTTNGPGDPASSTWVTLATPQDCAAPITPPTLPEVVPGEAELDPATGLHVTGTPVEVDLATWRLEVTGLVERPLSLSYDELRCLPKVAASPTLICPGFFRDQATWAGVPLRDVLEAAGLQGGATRVRLLAADGYSFEVDLTPDVLGSAFLAYELEGETLPVLHGFPLRLVLPGRDGYHWVKWLVGIEVGGPVPGAGAAASWPGSRVS